MALTATEEAETRQLLAQLTELLSLADNQPAIISELGADDITIPELDAVTSILTTDEFLLNQGGTVKRATGTNLFDFTQTYVRLTTYIATKNYVIGDRVVGSDNNIYKCLIANGPTTSVVNPVGDNTSTWKMEKDVKIASFKGLKASRPTVSTVSFDIDEIILTDTDGYPLKLEGISGLVIDITTDLDTGTEASSTWYYPWIFAKADGTYIGRFSLSATNPTMPSEYVYKCRLSAIYNDLSGDLTNIRQKERWISLPGSSTALLAGLNQATYTSLDVSAIIPSEAYEIKGVIRATDGTTNSATSYIASSINGHNEAYLNRVASSPGQTDAPYTLIIDENQTVYWKNQGIASASTSIYISGYKI